MRIIKNINSGWRFIQKNVKESEVLSVKGKKVNLPHTWNAIDGQDGGNDYFRGTCCYIKKFTKDMLPSGDKYFFRIAPDFPHIAPATAERSPEKLSQ